MSILEVFYQPGVLFSSLEKRRAAWVLPLIIGIILSGATTYFAIHKIGMESIIRQRIQNSNLSPDQMQQQLQAANTPIVYYITLASVLVAVPIVDLVIAGWFMLFALIGSKQPKFSTNFSLVTLAYLPYTVIAAVMSILVLVLAPDPTTLDVNNLLSTNIGAFIDKDTTGKFLYSFLGSMDVLVFAEIGFLTYGFSKVNRTTKGFAFLAIVLPWFVYVLGKAGISAVFG